MGLDTGGSAPCRHVYRPELHPDPSGAHAGKVGVEPVEVGAGIGGGERPAGAGADLPGEVVVTVHHREAVVDAASVGGVVGHDAHSTTVLRTAVARASG